MRGLKAWARFLTAYLSMFLAVKVWGIDFDQEGWRLIAGLLLNLAGAGALCELAHSEDDLL